MRVFRIKTSKLKVFKIKIFKLETSNTKSSKVKIWLKKVWADLKSLHIKYKEKSSEETISEIKKTAQYDELKRTVKSKTV